MEDEVLKYGDKELRLGKVDNSSLFRWRFTSGGELPRELQGSFTGTKEAVFAVTQANKRRDEAVKVAIQEAEQKLADEEEADAIKAEAAKAVAAKKPVVRKRKPKTVEEA